MSAATNLPQKRSSFVYSRRESGSGPCTDPRPGAGARPDSGCDAGGRARAANGHLREAERLAAFVYGIARNVINNYLRTRSRLPRLDPLDVELKPPRHARPSGKQRAHGLVRHALAILDSTDRQILRLTLMEGLKPGEIAERLGLRPRSCELGSRVPSRRLSNE